MSDVRRVLTGRTASLAVAALGLIGLMAAPSAASARTNGALPGRPTRAAIRWEMKRTIEAGDTSEHFTPSGRPVTTRDGSFALTASVGQRVPTADGYGQLVFFWRGRTFLGWDSIYESVSVLRITRWGSHTLRVTYAHYAAKDPAYDPSLRPVNVFYRWRHGRLAGDRLPPSLSYLGQQVELKPVG
jgi:LppP/LprE lipoprotein